MDRVTRRGGPRVDTDRVIRLLIRLAIYLVSSVVGLLVADAILDDMTVEASGLVTVVVIFTIAQAILGPFIAMTVARNANAFLGGVGLVTTFVALLIASTLGDALEISGVAHLDRRHGAGVAGDRPRDAADPVAAGQDGYRGGPRSRAGGPGLTGRVGRVRAGEGPR